MTTPTWVPPQMLERSKADRAVSASAGPWPPNPGVGQEVGQRWTQPHDADTVEVCVTEHLHPTTIHMVSKASLTGAGRLTVTSRGVDFQDTGGSVGVLALLYGRGSTPQWLWNTTPVRYGIHPAAGRWAEAGISFTQDIDPHLLTAARYLAVKQFLCPSGDAWTHIKTWLAAAQAPITGFRAAHHTARILPPSPP